MLSLKNSLAVLKKTDALLEGHFVLSSGLHSPQYVQCAKLLSKPNQAKKFISSLATKIKQNIKNFDVILSPAMGGVIIDAGTFEETGITIGENDTVYVGVEKHGGGS